MSINQLQRYEPCHGPREVGGQQPSVTMRPNNLSGEYVRFKDVEALLRATKPVIGLPTALSMDTAPKNGTMIRLLVQFEDHSLEDHDGPVWTIGHNTFEGSGEDLWQFAGWCWTHDHFTEGKGTPVGWLPMHANANELPKATQTVSLASLINILNETCRHSHGTRFEHLTATIRDVDAALARLQLIEPMTSSQHLAMPRATFTEIDQYTKRARHFLAGTTSGYPELANVAVSYIAEMLAFMDGKRIRGA